MTDISVKRVKYFFPFLPGLMLFTTARNAFPSLQLGPKSLTWTPSCLETWAWTHCNKAFLAPTFHFSWVFLLMLPSRTDLKCQNMQVSISMLANLCKITGHHQCCLHNHVCQRWGWHSADQVFQGHGCFLQSKFFLIIKIFT